MNERTLTEITLEDIESLAVGAGILGTGGGGSPYLGLLNLRRLYAQGYRVQLMSPLDLDDDDRVAVVSNMGAPLIGQERLADSRNIARAVEIQEEYSGQKFRAVMSLEIGGGNGIQPLMAAAHLGLPVVDADTMGRADPRRGCGKKTVPRQGCRRRPPDDRGVSARPRRDRGARRGPRKPARDRVPERMGRRLARRRARCDVARSYLRPRHRVGHRS